MPSQYTWKDIWESPTDDNVRHSHLLLASFFSHLCFRWGSLLPSRCGTVVWRGEGGDVSDEWTACHHGLGNVDALTFSHTIPPCTISGVGRSWAVDVFRCALSFVWESFAVGRHRNHSHRTLGGPSVGEIQQALTQPFWNAWAVYGRAFIKLAHLKEARSVSKGAAIGRAQCAARWRGPGDSERF
jgi:hypothetical protein